MPLKQDRTSYNISNNLKASMQAKGFNTLTWTHTIIYNGIAKTGTDTKKVDAIAKALRKLIDDLP